jgi:N-acetylneuraminic acid mutarotase
MLGSSPAVPAIAQETGLPEVAGWSLGPPLLAGVSEQAVASLGSEVYVLGGYPPGRIPWDVVQVYDTTTRRWSYGPPLPIPMHHVVAASANGKMYAIGGEFQGGGSNLPPIFMNTLFELDPAVGEWVARNPMPTGRSAGGAAVIDGKIYVAGGRPPQGHDFSVYDTDTDTWTELPQVPTDRNHLAVGAIGGKVYVAGGRFGAGFDSEKTTATELFDPATGTWSQVAPMLKARGGVAGAVANGCLFVIGGEGNYDDPRGLFVENEAYDPRTNTWISLTQMPTPTHGLGSAVLVDGTIYLPGGSVTLGGGTGSVINWMYRPEISCE